MENDFYKIFFCNLTTKITCMPNDCHALYFHMYQVPRFIAQAVFLRARTFTQTHIHKVTDMHQSDNTHMVCC